MKKTDYSDKTRILNNPTKLQEPSYNKDITVKTEKPLTNSPEELKHNRIITQTFIVGLNLLDPMYLKSMVHLESTSNGIFFTQFYGIYVQIFITQNCKLP